MSKTISTPVAVLFRAMGIGLSLASLAPARDAPPAAPVPPAAAAAGGISGEQMAKANNPLASMNALNFQDSWTSAIRGLSGDTMNTLNVGPVMVARDVADRTDFLEEHRPDVHQAFAPRERVAKVPARREG